MFFKSLLSAFALMFVVSHVSAQSFEATPTIGYRVSGGTDINSPSISRIEVKSNISYGVNFGYNATEQLMVEFSWSRHDTQFNGRTRAITPLTTPGSEVTLFGGYVDTLHGNLLYHFKDEDQKFRPYAVFGLGATRFSPRQSGVSSASRFSWGLGAGAKYFFNRNVGMRFEGRWLPTYLYSTGSGFWCDPFYGCFVVGNSHYLHQGNFSAGVVFRFGYR